MLIQWSSDYELGDEVVDFQHKKLVLLLNQLHDAVESNTQQLLVEISLDELVKYTQTHFTQEESIMDDTEGLTSDFVDSHKKAHRNFVDKIENFKKEYYAGKAEVSQELITFLKDWLVNHILVTDKKLVETSLEHKASA